MCTTPFHINFTLSLASSNLFAFLPPSLLSSPPYCPYRAPVRTPCTHTLSVHTVLRNLSVQPARTTCPYVRTPGLPIMAHRPAPIQISFLGLPTTTGATFIDYYLSDWIAVPSEHVSHFSEKLILLPPSYIVNDYAQVQGEVINHNNYNNMRADRSYIAPNVTVDSKNNNNNINGNNKYSNDNVSKNKKTSDNKKIATKKDIENDQNKEINNKNNNQNSPNINQILFGTLSNSQKVDPTIFHVWMNLLRKFPSSKMIFIEYKGYEFSVPNILNYTRYYGIMPGRLINSPQKPWLDHLYSKTALDLVLDTSAKNGHTTGLDGVWAGVPTATIGKYLRVRAIFHSNLHYLHFDFICVI